MSRRRTAVALKRSIQPKLNPGGTGYYVHFRHPLKGKGVKAGLGVREEATARAICDHLAVFCSTPSDFTPVDGPENAIKAAADKAAAAGYHLTAVKIWFGVVPFGRQLTPWEERVEAMCQVDAKARTFFTEYVPALEAKVQVLAPRVEELEIELARLRRKSGTHARVPLRQAVETWAKEYPTGHAARAVRQVITCVHDFVSWADAQPHLGKRIFVGQIRRGDVAKWLAGVRRTRPARRDPAPAVVASTSSHVNVCVVPAAVAGAGRPSAHNGTHPTRAREQRTLTDNNGYQAQELSPVTRKKFRAYISTFYSWAIDRYELEVNPTYRLKIPGVPRTAEDIQAIGEYKDLLDIAGALRDWPYWRTLWLVGVLMGPRWDELRLMRISRVCLKSRSVSIWAPKTKRKRNVPIEGTLLLPELRAHLIRRAREIQVDLPLFRDQGDSAQPSAIKAEALSDLLFPCYLKKGTIARTKTEAGSWSHNATFLRAYRKVIKEAWKKHSNATDWSKAPASWSYGPREWRHSAGAAMAHCGCSSLEISQWLGNTEEIAKLHYIPHSSGERWPLDYHGVKK